MTFAATVSLAVTPLEQERDVSCLVRMPGEQRERSIVELPEYEAGDLATERRFAVKRRAKRFFHIVRFGNRLSLPQIGPSHEWARSQRVGRPSCASVIAGELGRLSRRRGVSYGK